MSLYKTTEWSYYLTEDFLRTSLFFYLQLAALRHEIELRMRKNVKEGCTVSPEVSVAIHFNSALWKSNGYDLK